MIFVYKGSEGWVN